MRGHDFIIYFYVGETNVVQSIIFSLKKILNFPINNNTHLPWFPLNDWFYVYFTNVSPRAEARRVDIIKNVLGLAEQRSVFSLKRP